MNGLFEMKNMGIISSPGLNISVSITVNAVDLRVPSTNQYLTKYFSKD